VLRELQRVRDEVLEDLSKASRVGQDVGGDIGRCLDREPDALCQGNRFELANHVVGDLRDGGGCQLAVAVPDSILARSKMLLSKPRRSRPDARITAAYSTCRWLIFRSGSSASCSRGSEDC